MRIVLLHTHDAAGAAGVLSTLPAVQRDVRQRQIEQVRDHAAAVKAALDGADGRTVRIVEGVIVLALRRGRGEDGRLASGQRHAFAQLVLANQHLNLSRGCRSAGLRGEFQVVVVRKARLQRGIDRRLAVDIEEVVVTVGDLAHDLIPLGIEGQVVVIALAVEPEDVALNTAGIVAGRIPALALGPVAELGVPGRILLRNGIRVELLCRGERYLDRPGFYIAVELAAVGVKGDPGKTVVEHDEGVAQLRVLPGRFDVDDAVDHYLVRRLSHPCHGVVQPDARGPGADGQDAAVAGLDLLQLIGAAGRDNDGVSVLRLLLPPRDDDEAVFTALSGPDHHIIDLVGQRELRVLDGCGLIDPDILVVNLHRLAVFVHFDVKPGDLQAEVLARPHDEVGCCALLTLLLAGHASQLGIPVVDELAQTGVRRVAAVVGAEVARRNTVLIQQVHAVGNIHADVGAAAQSQSGDVDEIV